MCVVSEGAVIGAGRATGTRERIVRAAAGLLAEGGRDAVSTRAVAAAAGVQAPTIYRQFGDMRGLLDAVAEYGFSEYLREKVSQENVEDPVEELRRGWDMHVGFGLANPAFYALMYADPGNRPDAARKADEMLRAVLQRVAEAGRLRVGVERAAGIVHAAGMGVVLSSISLDPEHRDPGLSEATREAVHAVVLTDKTPEGTDGATGGRPGSDRLANRAVSLKAVLPDAGERLTPGERAVLCEWLDRLADPAP